MGGPLNHVQMDLLLWASYRGQLLARTVRWGQGRAMLRTPGGADLRSTVSGVAVDGCPQAGACASQPQLVAWTAHALLPQPVPRRRGKLPRLPL